MVNLDRFTKYEITQIQYVLDLCQSKIYIYTILLNDCKLSDRMEHFLTEFADITGVTEKVIIETYMEGDNTQLESKITAELKPVITLMDKEGKYMGVNFHGVPYGHELESFMHAIYNVAGPGQKVGDDIIERATNLKQMNLKIGISSSCSRCPELVQACHRLATINENITAEMVDLSYYPDLQKKFKIMSIPALIINNNDVLFGQKSIEELMDYLEKY